MNSEGDRNPFNRVDSEGSREWIETAIEFRKKILCDRDSSEN